jgi:hypothetical protein
MTLTNKNTLTNKQTDRQTNNKQTINATTAHEQRHKQHTSAERKQLMTSWYPLQKAA